MGNVGAAQIAAFLGRPLDGADGRVVKPADLADCGPGDLVWVKGYSEDRLAALERGRPALAICDAQTASRTTVAHVCSDNPRLDFIRALRQFFVTEEAPVIHPTAVISPEAEIGDGVSIGAHACVGPGVSVGAGCVIGPGVVLEGNTRLGQRCRIKANAVIGAPGFGFEYDEEGAPLHFPHIGRVILEDDVWIGACSTIERAGLGVTRLCSGVKVDDLVQIGHNVSVGANTLVMANVVLCGGVVVGTKCWIAPNSVVKQRVVIGDGATVGLGAVVLKDVDPGAVVAGVPAKPLPPRP
jgi:UDP-3-O-[3-hydroxymyristoyl] glucosamine N-acyltransferase